MITLPVLYALLAAQPAYPATDTFTAQAETLVELEALYPDVEVADVRWLPCKAIFGDYEENGFYQPADHSITLCTEMERYPDAAVGMVAHEFAHAVEDQRLGLTTEQDADELGTLMMLRLHHPSEMIAFGQWLRGDPTLDDGKHQDGDPHPGNAFRLWEISCIVGGGLDEGPAQCKSLYEGLKLRFDQRLATP